ncbi:MAG: tetratricopeptide repeat protein [Nitrospirae bacterium]|nr:MAG: tetratricopeptide repeat protein [Nitrospirota bacterium]
MSFITGGIKNWCRLRICPGTVTVWTLVLVISGLFPAGLHAAEKGLHYYYDVGDWGKVVASFNASVSEITQPADLNRVAEAYYMLGNYRSAADVAQKALQIADNTDSKILLLLIQAKKGAEEKALTELRLISNNKGDAHKAYYAMGLIKAPADPKAALSYFQTAVGSNPDDFRSWFQIGLIYEEEELFEEATKAYKHAVRVNPLSAQAQNNLGYSYKERHFYAYAVEHYLKAIELRPDEPGYYYNIGNAYTHQEKIDKAFDAYKKALELAPAFAKARYNMGRTYLRKDMVREAIEEFKLYLKYGNNAVFSFVTPRSAVEDEIEQLEFYLEQNSPGGLQSKGIAR